jgi:hypothetical protein
VATITDSERVRCNAVPGSAKGIVMASSLMFILLLVVLFVPWLLLALGSDGYTVRRPGEEDSGPQRVPPSAAGELPELLRRPLRARVE